MASSPWINLELRLGDLSESDLTVLRVVGREALSTLFRFEVDCQSASNDLLELATLVEQEALLTLQRPDGTRRIVHGVAEAVELREVRAGVPIYRMRVVPRLALLAHTADHRVFQDKTVPEIVTAILDEAKVDLRLALSGSYPPRELCVQYRESDFDFVARLLEEEGIFWFFEHADDGHTLVLADSPSTCSPIEGDPVVPWRLPTSVGEEAGDEHLFELARVQRKRVARVALRDFEFTRPTLDLTASAKTSDGAEVYQYPGLYESPQEGRRLAKVRLEEVRYGQQGYEGGSSCLRLLPGTTFESSGHPDDAMNQTLLVVRLEHQAKQIRDAGDAAAVSFGYENKFVAQPASAPYRPRRQTPRPVIVGAQTATIVGPDGEEVHPDAHGRVKVQFHWDRLGKRDDKASCWIRLAQAWAGAGFGASFVPRVGQEVLVRFLGGNPDRPLVTGAIYNGQNPPPLPLPADKTQSTLRSDSSPGGGGFNELRFEDANGDEQIYLHAQKDHRIEVNNDKAQRVVQHEALSVEKDRARTIKGSQHLVVDANDSSRINGSQSLTIGGNRTTRVHRDHREQIEGNSQVTVGMTQDVGVGGAMDLNVLGLAALTVGAGYLVTVGAAQNTAVMAAKAAQVGGAAVEATVGFRRELVGKNSTARIGMDFATQVVGQVSSIIGKDSKEEVGAEAALEAKETAALLAKSFKLEADSLKLVVDGQVVIAIKKSGNVEIAGDAITLDGSGSIVFKGAQIEKVAGAGPGSGSAQVKALADEDEGKQLVNAQFKTASGKNALDGVKFELKLPGGGKKDGSIRSGAFTIGGSDPGACELHFPDLGDAPKKK